MENKPFGSKFWQEKITEEIFREKILLDENLGANSLGSKISLGSKFWRSKFFWEQFLGR